jgi:hypothetical protein
MRRRGLFRSTLLAGLSAVLLATAPAAADAPGLGLSGTFTWQRYEMVPGTSVSSPAVYVIVQNSGEAAFDVTMRTDSPDGVDIGLDAAGFTLEPGKSRRVEITVSVGAEVAPGEYRLGVTAEASAAAEGPEPRLVGAVGQEASLVVKGESARVIVLAPGPASAIFLARISDGHESQAGYSGTGRLEATVTPGHYRASTGDRDGPREEFDVAAGEAKTVTLGNAAGPAEAGIPGWELAVAIVAGLAVITLAAALVKRRNQRAARGAGR